MLYLALIMLHWPKKGTSSNIVINEGFEKQRVDGSWINVNEIKSWTGYNFEIEKGTIYSYGGASQVVV